MFETQQLFHYQNYRAQRKILNDFGTFRVHGQITKHIDKYEMSVVSIYPSKRIHRLVRESLIEYSINVTAQPSTSPCYIKSGVHCSVSISFRLSAKYRVNYQSIVSQSSSLISRDYLAQYKDYYQIDIETFNDSCIPKFKARGMRHK